MMVEICWVTRDTMEDDKNNGRIFLKKMEEKKRK